MRMPGTVRTTRWGSWATGVAGALVCVASLGAGPTQAGTVITKTSSLGNQVFDSATDPHLIDLGEGNGTALTVRTSAASTRLLILFNGECRVASADHDSWLRVEIVVDGVVAAPSGGDHALCTGSGDSILGARWVTAASDASMTVGPGVHTVELRGGLGFGTGIPGDDWWVGDLSLIVIANDL